MSSPDPDHIRMPSSMLWLLRIGCPLIGFGLAFAIKPLVRWAVDTLDSAPGPLRLAAEIPTPWAVPILTVLGGVVGYWLSYEAERDSLAVTVRPDSLSTADRDTERYIQRSQVGSVFTDPKDLVILAPDAREVFRGSAADLPKSRLATALRRHDYPWHGTSDPYEDQYQRWVDGHPDLDEPTNALMRARHTALRSKNPGEADDLHSRLQDGGIVVRDRDKKQQYRRLAEK